MGISKAKPADPKTVILHGTAVLLKDVDFPPSVVFLRGLSGAGKSDLAFRLIEVAGGVLVCDDQVAFERRQDSKIYAACVDSIRGLLEVRGIGLLHVPVADPSRLRLVIDLVKPEEVPRLPDPDTVDILGVAIPRFRLHAFDVSATMKVHKAMEVVHKPDIIVK